MRSDQPGWSTDDMPDQSGRVVVVTGANSGIGYAAAEALAGAGADVVLACRSSERGNAARRRLEAKHPDASVTLSMLDLANLTSVAAFAGWMTQNHDRVDLLINNAGVMAIPYRTTADGFEMQMGTNHFGHFALTGRLLPMLLEAETPRVVSVSSHAHWIGWMQLDDLNFRKWYQKWFAYAQSKLANLLFAFELQRRFEAAATDAISVGCHPGYTATELQLKGPRMEGNTISEQFSRLSQKLLAQSAREGALPTLFAATDPSVRGGEYIGPSGLLQLWGPPERVSASQKSRDPELAATLWARSEELTGVTFDELE